MNYYLGGKFRLSAVSFFAKKQKKDAATIRAAITGKQPEYAAKKVIWVLRYRVIKEEP